MELGDARKLTQDAQETLRLRAVKVVVKDGRSCTEAAKLFGVARGTVSRWVSAYKGGNEVCLRKKKRGRRSQDMCYLKPYQCATIVNIIRDRCPDQLKFPFALWTREAVRNLIETKFGLKLALNTVGNYLKKWGFTAQKPLRRAYQRQDSAVQKWLENTYPQIAQKAHAEKAEIHWGDEAGFRSDHQTGTSYSPKGKTPVIECTAKRFRTNMISTVTNKGTLRFMLFDKNFTTDIFIDFLRRLICKSKVKIFLILDNHKVHHAYKVQDWVEAHKEKIELFFLPPYCPELNPDELLNQDVKSNAVGRERAKTLTDLKKNVRLYLFGTQQSPDIVKSYFQKSEVKYAA
jgi:transposase